MSQRSRTYELLLRALPEDFREQHREDIAEMLSLYAADRPSWSRWLVLVRAALDILWVALLLRIRPRHRNFEAARPLQGRALLPRMESIVQDIGQCVRSLRRDAGLAAFATLIVGFGVGATSTVFSAARAILLRPLPFDDPDRLVWISNGEWKKGQELSSISVQVAHVQDLRAQTRILSGVAGYSLFDAAGDHTLTGGDQPERITRLRVTADFFELLGVRPMHGRLFTAEELEWGGPRAALLLHGFWERRFAADPEVVGRAVTIDGAPVTVVGVLPSSFDFSSVFSPGSRVDYVEPFPLGPETNRQGNMLALVARLRPGVTLEAAQEEVGAIARRPHGEQRNRFAPVLSPLREHVSGGIRSAMLVLGGAVALVMLIVCANLSNLLLVRGVSRQKEIAVRAALGAARGRLIRQMLTESVLLAVIGGALGTLLAAAGTRALARMDGNIPMLAEVRLDAVVLAFTLGITLLAGLVFGVAPAIRMSTSALQETLKEGGRGASPGRRQSWVQGGLVASEVALACTLLIGAGLLTRSFVRVLDIDMGFEPRNSIALRIDPSTPFTTPSAADAYYDDALHRVRVAAGVEAAGLADILPMGFNRTWGARPGEIPVSGDLDAFRFFPYVRIVSEGYIESMGLSLVAGRDFTDGDDRGSRPVIIINEALARAIWPGEDALGRVLVPSDGRDVEREVVGIVRGTRYLAPEQEPGPEMFLPLRQHADFSAVHLIARGQMRPVELAANVGEALRPLDSRLPVKDAVVIEHIVARSVSARRLMVTLLAGFAVFALALASVGIYGVISYSVRQRTKELGIRLALGASERELRTRVLLQTLALAAAGITLGLPAAWVLGRAMQSLLFDVPATDPVTFAAVPAALIVVAAVAGYVPALRGSRVDPMRALGGEG